MSDILKGFEPVGLWHYFDQIRQIPRESGNETAVVRYLIEFARNNHLDYQSDEVGNVIIRKPASPGNEGKPGVVLQAHVDMVCEKNSDKAFDFATDPIQLRVDGDWLLAQDTTLGADNGIGVAAAMYVLTEPNLVHGPIEALFTVDEERGLTGANNLKPGILKGSYLINLDSEDEGVFTVGCAGGRDSTLYVPISWITRSNPALTIKVGGLKGGHSGVDINMGKGNSIKLMARLLQRFCSSWSLCLADIKGGSKRNAIPREAEAVIGYTGNAEQLIHEMNLYFEQMKSEFCESEPDMKLQISQGVMPGQFLRQEDTARLINLLIALPHGVIAMSQTMKDKVETSTNLATISIEQNQVSIGEMSRSSNATGMDLVCGIVLACAEPAKADIFQSSGYPGWQPNLKSELLKTMIRLHSELFKKEPIVESIHAGLETGIIGKQYPAMDMISIGPDIRFPHSPDEKVRIPSVNNFWILLKQTLIELAK